MDECLKGINFAVDLLLVAVRLVTTGMSYLFLKVCVLFLKSLWEWFILILLMTF